MDGVMKRAVYDPRPAARIGSWATLAIAGLLMLLSIPIFPNDLQALGNNLVATVILAGGLVWHIQHPPSQHTVSALSPAVAELQPNLKTKPRYPHTKIQKQQ